MFRSCLRKEYRDQVIKMLRAVPGEFTRTAYRTQWIDPQVVEIIQQNEPFRVVAFLVDANLSRAVPCRILTPAEPPRFDDRIGVCRFVFTTDEFVDVPATFNDKLSEWPDSRDTTPPMRFVTPLRDSWYEPDIGSNEMTLRTWKKSIDFLTETWEVFDNTVFFRPDDGTIEGAPSGPVRRVLQSENTKFGFYAYNPHFTDEQLQRKRIHPSLGGVIGDVETFPKVPRDGYFEVSASFLESGEAQFRVEVRPDEQFSAYVPFTVFVNSNDEIDPAGPRVLGAEWARFLNEVVQNSVSDRSGAEDLLTRLSSVFAGDPELSLQRGRLHLLQGQYAAARDEFSKVLEKRNDARATWWSLIAALHMGQQTDVIDLLDRLDLSGTDSSMVLFNQAAEAMRQLSDDTIEWFADLPGMVLSEDKTSRLLLEMGDNERGETATRSIFRALGRMNPEAALRRARGVLATNPNWSALRHDVALLALSAGMAEFAEDDADILIQYSGGPIEEYEALVHDLRPLIHPYRLPSLLMVNATRLMAEDDPDAHRLARLLSYMSAEQAASNGDFLAAQQAINFLEHQLMDSDSENRLYRDQVNLIVGRMTRILQQHRGLSTLEDVYVDELAKELKPSYEGRTLVVFGSNRDEDRVSWATSRLGLGGIEWIGWERPVAPDPNKLRSVVSDQTPLLINSVDDGLLTEGIRTWLRSSRVPFARVIDTRSGWIEALRLLLPDSRSSVTYLPSSCAEAVEWVRMNCQHVIFCEGALDELEVLEQRQNHLHVARRIKEDLDMLNKFAERTLAGEVGLGFRNWAGLNGYPESKLSTQESKTTNDNPKYRSARTFQVPRQVDQSGWCYMPAHTKLPGTYPGAPRIHFTIEHIDSTKKVWVGYVGPHLENSQS